MSLDLQAAFAQLVATLEAEFAPRGFRTVAAESLLSGDVEVPAILLQIDALDPMPDADPITGQFPCVVRVVGRVLIARREELPEIKAATAAGELAAFVHKSRLGVRWGAAEVIAVDPDAFAPDVRGYVAWQVEWGHEANLGAAFAFPVDGPAETVFVGYDPEVGPDHVGSYDELTGGADV